MIHRPVLRIVARGGERIDVPRSGAVKTSLHVAGSDDRIVLLSWGANADPRLRNVARVAPGGALKWRASLPGQAERDCFVSLARSGELFVARTYTGEEARFDADGEMVTAELAD